MAQAFLESGFYRLAPCSSAHPKFHIFPNDAKEAGVADRTRFIEDSYLDVDFSDATVLALYLLPDSLAKLRSDFETYLEPGTKIVTHDFEIEGWEPIAERTVSPGPNAVSSGTIYLWEVPANDET